MIIGVDLRVLQIGHQYRGIGEVARRVLDGVFELAMADSTLKPQFVLYSYDDPIDPKDFLNIPDGLHYREVKVGTRPQPGDGRTTSQKLKTKWQAWYGDPLPQAAGCDVFLQVDYALGVPLKAKTVLIKHDLIPYVFWNDYFTSSWVHFRNKAARTTLRNMVHNYEYKRVLSRSVHNAWRILCVSEHTKRDVQKYLHVSPRKLAVAQLGVSVKPLKAAELMAAQRGQKSFPTKPFIMFVGAGDARRRVQDIVTAFNNLKADGVDIQLVLVGENFQSPEMIPNLVVRRSVMESSYADDILALGYVDDATKQRLYKEAVAFVFATAYEGFGIPVLEAMLFDCPVIAYANSSIPEVGGKHVFYAKDWETILNQVHHIMALTPQQKQHWVESAHKHADGFSWDKTASAVYDVLRDTKH